MLGSMEDAARALLATFDDTQRAAAIYDKVAPGDILSKTDVTINPMSPPGVAASALKPEQRDLLQKLIETYTVQMADDVAADRLAKIKQAGLEKVTFAWSGETEVGKKHYYRDPGPDVPRGVRQHAERWQSRPLRVARLHGRLRPRPAPRARQGPAALVGASA